ncbi:MAG: BrnT family toxin [Elusimicrobia bacterium]|nr:BrnT family toxin [Elusimicrobiota bacterium]
MKILEIIWTPEIIEKLERKHSVTADEVEEACSEPYVHIRKTRESRYLVFGRTDAGRYLATVVTYLGGGIVRVITSRDMEIRERDLYQRHL